MTKHITTTLAALVAACVLTACGSTNDNQQSTAPTPIYDAPNVYFAPDETDAPMPLAVEAPEIPAEMGEEKAKAVAMNFVEQWLTFSPSDFEPKPDWFARWQTYSTDDFRNQMRIQADQMWSWTWNNDQKSCCVEFIGNPAVAVGEKQAVAKVSLRRHKLDLFARSADIEQGRGVEVVDETYLITMQVGKSKFNIADVHLVPHDARLPEVL